MTQNQQGDVKLFQTDDEGDISVEGGLVEMNGGLETSVYLSLFGGNEDDDGRANSSYSWWGNLDETDTSKQYRSETQNILQALAATPNNLRRVEDAVIRDLSWLDTSSVTVVATMPAINKLKLTIDIDADRFEFVENWKASA